MKKVASQIVKPITICLVFIIAIVSAVLVFTRPAELTKISLSEEYLAYSEVENLDVASFDDLVALKKSFIILSYMPGCSAQILTYVKEFAIRNNISYYYMPWNLTRETPIKDTIKYPPTVMIYENGVLKYYLDSNSNDDVTYYNSVEEFTDWIRERINL